MENFDLESINSMMTEVASVNKEEAVKEIANTVASAPASNYSNRDNSDRPNIYMDLNINPKPVDLTKVKEAKAYALYAIDENPSEDTVALVTKVADILKAKKVIYRYDNTVVPSLARDIFMRQDLTIPNAYQLFLPYYKKEKFDLEGIATITNKWPSALSAQHAKHYSKITIKDKTDKTKVIEEFYGFSKATGGVRNMMANSIHMLLGKDCLTKLKFVIVTSSCECETMEDVKVKGYKEVSRRLQELIRRCSDFNIPIYNLNKKESIQKLLELIQTL